MLLLALAKYPGVAVVRPVSADWVPYAGKHLQAATLCSTDCVLGFTDLREGSRSRYQSGGRQDHRVAAGFPPEPGTFQPRSAHIGNRCRAPEVARPRGRD